MKAEDDHKPRGRRPFKPTDEQRRTVEVMAASGIAQQEIAMSLGISAPTLRRHFRAALDSGATKMITRVADSLYRQAIAGNVTACIFILKCRAGWSECGSAKLGKKAQAVLDAQQPPEGSRWSKLVQ